MRRDLKQGFYIQESTQYIPAYLLCIYISSCLFGKKGVCKFANCFLHTEAIQESLPKSLVYFIPKGPLERKVR